jgi:hypothetical protein
MIFNPPRNLRLKPYELEASHYNIDKKYCNAALGYKTLDVK